MSQERQSKTHQPKAKSEKDKTLVWLSFFASSRIVHGSRSHLDLIDDLHHHSITTSFSPLLEKHEASKETPFAFGSRLWNSLQLFFVFFGRAERNIDHIISVNISTTAQTKTMDPPKRRPIGGPFAYKRARRSSEETSTSPSLSMAPSEKGDDFFQDLLKQAQAGNAVAQCMVGDCYRFGTKNVDTNDEWAFHCYKKSAEQGNETAAYMLGRCYAGGRGVKKDRHQAVHWYTKAADEGHAHAQELLGIFYGRGHIVEKDKDKAICFLEKAVAQGSERAMLVLGDIHEGDDYDLNKALYWYQKALDHGNSTAKRHVEMVKATIAKRDELKGDKTAMIGLWASMEDTLVDDADMGDTDAQYHLGKRYSGDVFLITSGRPTNFRLAFKWLSKAAEHGHLAAQCALAKLCEAGRGPSEVDIFDAFAWYKRAAVCGSAEGMHNLGRCYEEGIAVETDLEKALVWYDKALRRGIDDGAKARYLHCRLQKLDAHILRKKVAGRQQQQE